IIESKLAPLLDKVLEGKSDIYIKSHPQTVEEGRSKLLIYITGWSHTKNEADEIVKKTSEELMEIIKKQGGKVIKSYVRKRD
ncbi:MAG: hypothetical protein QW372_06770, partial [Nitrososphaerales archaeon]